MRATAAILAIVLAAVSNIPAAGGRAAWAGGSPPAASPLPAALDRYYPPVAEEPVYLFKMLSLETSFSGIAADLMEGDVDGARGSFEEFRRHFREAGDMVPEWKREYPAKEIGELGTALTAGDGSAAMSAVAAIGARCHRCHQATMVPVQQKYRWGNMAALTVRDPVTEDVAGYAQFKARMAANLAGVTVDLRQGQPGNARRQFDAFRRRFGALGESCAGCHDAASRSYVNDEVRKTLEQLGEALSSSAPDAPAVTSLVRKIGGGSCAGCHLVHVPAALAAASRK